MICPRGAAIFGWYITVWLAAAARVSGGELHQEAAESSSPLHFINTAFEGASPLWWEIDEQGQVRVQLVYDQQRRSPNRANGHWLFEVQAEPSSQLTLVLGPFANVWNGQLSKPDPEAKVCFVSEHGRRWRPVATEPAEPYHVKVQISMRDRSLYVARLPPYRLSDLEQLKAELSGHPLVEIIPIGQTVMKRPLELIRVGRPDAPHAVLLRARAHPWESGGSWVIEGLVRRLLDSDATAAACLQRYCLYVLPMANKDGVARGWTRFNVAGMDLNRNWDRPADPALAPENAALEGWIETSLAQGRRLDLAIDLHNDASGLLHVSRPETDAATQKAYLEAMQHLERLLRKYTWFTEGSTKSSFRNPGTMGEGLLARYGIVACIHELNCNWIAGLNDYPSAAHWKTYGRQLAEVFSAYFEEDPQL